MNPAALLLCCFTCVALLCFLFITLQQRSVVNKFYKAFIYYTTCTLERCCILIKAHKCATQLKLHSCTAAGYKKNTTYFFTLTIIFFSILFAACNHKQPKLTNKSISDVVTKMNDIMVHDVTNPPLASRFFSYALLAGYEVVSQNDHTYKSMHGFLNDYPLIKKPDSIKNYITDVAALLAVMETAKKMQPSGKLLGDYETSFLDSCSRIGFTDEAIQNSLQYATVISKQILAYAKADHYNQISNLRRYTPIRADSNWYPTPPGFFAAVEPNFNTVRSFTLDSASQFKPQPLVKFDTTKTSAFYNLMNAVYNEGKQQAPEEHRTIAFFWDCNPFNLQDAGHLNYAIKKISPGAHWMGITGEACIKANKNFDETMFIHAMVAVGLMDGFICCWDEKYRSNRIRPETAIRKYIDATWQPLLQTPPFPEYLSGHSVVSASSAEILTHFFGDHFSYTDSVEVSFGLPPRSFNSFKQAAQEAAISRFYGGIHFNDAITNGLLQGEKVGKNVLKKIAAH